MTLEMYNFATLNASCMKIGDIHIEVERKAIRHIYLSVHAPDGRVHLSVPKYMSQADVEAFVLRKRAWIERQREKVLSRPREVLHYVSGENHYLFGQRLSLDVVEIADCTPSVLVTGDILRLTVRPNTSEAQRALLIAEYQRVVLLHYLTENVAYWQRIMSEPDVAWTIRKMRSEWGSCTPRKRKLLFNLELARMPQPCIDYIIVHELAHLRVPNHSPLFYARVEQFLPDWRARRKELKDFAVHHRGL